MSKKHFRALAQAFHNQYLNFVVQCEEDVARSVWRAMVNDTADVCAQCNPNFNRAKFIQACEEGL